MSTDTMAMIGVIWFAGWLEALWAYERTRRMIKARGHAVYRERLRKKSRLVDYGVLLLGWWFFLWKALRALQKGARQ